MQTAVVFLNEFLRRPEKGKCDVCGAPSATRDARGTPNRFCSGFCRGQFRQRVRTCYSKVCEHCRTMIVSPKRRTRFCSRACMFAVMNGTDAINWKGGRHVDTYGYAWIKLRAHPRSKGFGYVREHHVVMENRLGRPLEPHETVHHINGIRDDNRDENLQLRSGQHGSGVALKCGDCGSSNVVYTALAQQKSA